MKKLAFYLLLLFSLVQFGPGLQSVFSDAAAAIVLFNPDEEKGSDMDKGEAKPDKKNGLNDLFSDPRGLSLLHSAQLSFYYKHCVIGTPPLIDILTPPPNQA
jgi:hypothetical protein